MQIKNKIRILILTLFFFSGFSSIEPLKSNLNEEQEISKTNYLERIPRDDYLLGPGDLLTISIADALPELVGSYRVQGDGTVFLPKINKVFVQGLTVTDLDSALNEKYKEFVKRPNVNTILSEYRPIRVYIEGEIQNSGLYTLPGSIYPNNQKAKQKIKQNADEPFAKRVESTRFQNNQDLNINNDLFFNSRNVEYFPTVFEVIRLAGGITPFSDLSNIRIVRKNSPMRGGGKIQTNLNFLALINDGDNSQNIRIYDGDVISIRKSESDSIEQLSKAIKSNLNPKFINVFVTGMVESQGLIQVSRSSTLNEAIDIAGGKKALSGPVTLIRINPDGSLDKRKIRFSRRNKNGSQKNPYLRERDIITVGKSKFNVASTIISEVTAPFVGVYATYNLFD